jgi:hypothetical protein
MAKHIILSRAMSKRRNTISTYLTSRNWPARFPKRHSHLQDIIAKPIEKSRKDACTWETFNGWFNRYRDHFEKHKPELRNIYNIDETGFVLGDGERAYVIIDKILGSEVGQLALRKDSC